MRMNKCWCFYFVILLICCSQLYIKNRTTPVYFVCSKSTDASTKDSVKNDESSSRNEQNNQLSGVHSESSSDNILHLSPEASFNFILDKLTSGFPFDISVYPDDVLADVLNIFLNCLQDKSMLSRRRRSLHSKIRDLKECCMKKVSENIQREIHNDAAKSSNTDMINIEDKSVSSRKYTGGNKRFGNRKDKDSVVDDIKSDVSKNVHKTSDDKLSDISHLSYLFQKPEDNRKLTYKEEDIVNNGLSSLWEKESSWNNFSDDESTDDYKRRNHNSHSNGNINRPGYGTGDMSKAYGCQGRSDRKLIYDRRTYISGKKSGSGLQPRNMFFSFLLECSTNSWGSGKKTIACIKTKLQEKGVRMSDQCLECFKESVECGKSNCWWSCMFKSPCSDSCFKCGVNNCKNQLVQCTGLNNLPDACS